MRAAREETEEALNEKQMCETAHTQQVRQLLRSCIHIYMYMYITCILQEM